jgi:hypothetical protein
MSREKKTDHSHYMQLLNEKRQLRTFCRQQEKKLSEKFTEFRKDVPGMIVDGILPYTPDKNRSVEAALDFANDFIMLLLPERLRNHKVSALGLKLLEVLTIRLISNRKEKQTRKD